MRHACIVAVLLAACSARQTAVQEPQPKPATAPPTPAPTAGDLTLGLGEITVYFASMPSERVHADGTIETWDRVFAHDKNEPIEEWVTFGKITADGKVSGNAGQIVWTLQPDGAVKVTSGEAEPFTLHADAVDTADHHVTIDGNGVVHGLEPGYDIRVEGATDPARTRTALLIVALWNQSSMKK